MFDYLKHRSMQTEEMDNLDLSGKTITDTLDQLSKINKYLGNNHAVINALKKDILASKKTLTIIDLGCGGGDLIHSIAAFAKSQNIEVNLIGIDGNQHILDYAQSKSSAYPNIHFKQHDILANDFELPTCDILLSSHFMYHFKDADLIQFLAKAKQKVKHKILISELQRSVLSHQLFLLLSFILFFPAMIRKDGRKAISRSFRKPEIKSIFDRAQLSNYSIQWKWAFRFLVTIETE